MEVSISDVIGEGIDRTIKRNGIILMGIVFVLTAIRSLISPPQAQTVSALGLIVTLIISLVLMVVTIAALRVFVSDETERLPGEYFSHNMGWAVVNYIIGGIVFGIVLVIGTIALVIPGLFLLTALYFWHIYVAVEDENFIASFQGSWALTRGHRFNLFVLGVAIVVLSAIVGSIIGGIVGFIVGLASSTIGFAIGSAIGVAIVSVFTWATSAAAYNRLIALSDGDTVTAVDDREDVASPDDASESV